MPASKPEIVSHVFGSPEDGQPSRGERYCNEPEVPGACYERIYHPTFEMLPSGNFICLRCNAKFIEDDPS